MLPLRRACNVMLIVSNVRLMGPDFAMAMHGVNQDMVTNRPAKHVQLVEPIATRVQLMEEETVTQDSVLRALFMCQQLHLAVNVMFIVLVVIQMEQENVIQLIA